MRPQISEEDKTRTMTYTEKRQTQPIKMHIRHIASTAQIQNPQKLNNIKH